MPALEASPPIQPATSVPYFYEKRWSDAPRAQGIEGKQISAKAEEVFRHWSERAEMLVMRNADAADFSYEQVPPKRTFYVMTRYVYVGKGRPQPFDLDDE
jgi:hypothetical protein